jgi:hypothetical protein
MDRTVELKVSNDWVKLDSIKDLYEGCTFRMFEWDGKPVTIHNGVVTDFLATSKPYYSDKFKAWAIDVDITKYADIIN